MGLFFKKKKVNKNEKTEEKIETVAEEKEQKEKTATQQKSAKKETVTEKKTEKQPKTEKKDVEKSKKPVYRVIYDKEARLWLIKKDGAKRTIASFVTKEEALNRVKDLSVSNDLNYVVHKKDGKFQKK